MAPKSKLVKKRSEITSGFYLAFVLVLLIVAAAMLSVRFQTYTRSMQGKLEEVRGLDMKYDYPQLGQNIDRLIISAINLDIGNVDRYNAILKMTRFADDIYNKYNIKMTMANLDQGLIDMAVSAEMLADFQPRSPEEFKSVLDYLLEKNEPSVYISDLKISRKENRDNPEESFVVNIKMELYMPYASASDEEAEEFFKAEEVTDEQYPYENEDYENNFYDYDEQEGIDFEEDDFEYDEDFEEIFSEEEDE